MKINFKIKDNIYLESDDYSFDLHNNFDLIRVKYEIEEDSLILYYKSLAKNEKVKELQIIHKDLAFIKIYKDLKDESGFYVTDSKTISSITFYSSDDRDNNLSITYQEKPEVKDDIIYLLENDSYIRLSCREIILEVR